jgi:hypothetical protein
LDALKRCVGCFITVQLVGGVEHNPEGHPHFRPFIFEAGEVSRARLTPAPAGGGG